MVYPEILGRYLNSQIRLSDLELPYLLHSQVFYLAVLELANSINPCNFSTGIYSIISDKSSSLIALLERIPPRQ